jgi:hypothetical protein
MIRFDYVFTNGAWIEILFENLTTVNGFYFKKVSLGQGILFARLEYWDEVNSIWVYLKRIDYLIEIEYIFKDFIVNTSKLRLYVEKVEPLSETQISKIIVYGE